MKFKRSGLTIVELLIVIVVIGILAAISIVTYNGVQDRANDTLRRDGAKKIEKAYKLYKAETGINPHQLPCGYNDGGGGWIQLHTATGNYAGPTCIDILADKGYINKDFTDTVPIGTPYRSTRQDYTYMLHSCGSDASALVWYLKNPTEQETADYRALSQHCTGSTVNNMYQQYGMNTGIKIEQ